ncbi:hypothetical protein PMAYCL1PPCAC_15322, partial [Pristionchus mayeri]
FVQLESFSPCGESGYALNFGLPNCAIFEEKEGLFTASGKEFLNCTKHCLADFISVHIIEKDVADCAATRSTAFDSHVDCYINCGFCKILAANVIPFARTYRFSDFVSLSALKQVKHET